LETIYNVLEAKFAAERSPGVGKGTWISLNSPDYAGDPPYISDEAINAVREVWEKDNLKRRKPKHALAIIKDVIKSDDNPKPGN
jgi:hypothetical protein